MKTLAEKYLKLKTSIGGNREKRRYEETFGMPVEEQHAITPPNRWHRRILGEMEFVLRLSEEAPELCTEPLQQALDFLLACIQEEGAITRSDILQAESILSPVTDAAKSYKLILAGHAHIDMNWMWSWQETVAATLDTFRTMLAIMDEYPHFHFSQSQASVYKIVEDFDPDMMKEIQKRITEGRWEVTASAWVEQDKNMPSTESMARHLMYTKKYLHDVWGLDPATLELDFSPDTFGHSAHLPELVSHGGVKYYYHCRGTHNEDVLYRWRSPSGAELLIYREPYWYNSGITPHIGSGLIDVSRRCAGLKTGLIVYGVGDHGGGPTRRDIERAMEMMDWPIYPSIRFGTIREYFHEAETVRDQLKVEDSELNFIFTGCLTTQSRIKAGNRKSEAALRDAEALNSLAATLTGAPYRNKAYEKAWQNVLFTHFHDILTGSCVQDAREHAMGLYSEAIAVANTQRGNAMRAIAARIDTSALIREEDLSDTQAEGAGPGFGSENVSIPGPSMGTGTGGFSAQGMTRAAGKHRLFHLFNPSAHGRHTVTELTVWDWTGDLSRVRFTDPDNQPIPHQLIDHTLQHYWDHKYFRVLVEMNLPPLGYATCQLDEAPMTAYPFFFQPHDRTDKPHDDYVMDNGLVRAVFDRQSAELTSLIESESGHEYIKPGDYAGLRLLETEALTSSAWKIGRTLRETRLTGNTRVHFSTGPLRQQLDITIPFESSTAKVVVTLDKGASALQYELEIDWQEIGRQDATVPVLSFAVPSALPVQEYLFDVPGGSQRRNARHQDVPGLQYGAALLGEKALAIFSDSKYGYRGADNRISLTLINASTYPDPFPECGIHRTRLAIAVGEPHPKHLAEKSFDFSHLPAYLSAGAHAGTLPTSAPLLELSDDTTAVLSGIKQAEENGDLIVRLYNTANTTTSVNLVLHSEILSATEVDFTEQAQGKPLSPEGRNLAFTLHGAATKTIRICMDKK